MITKEDEARLENWARANRARASLERFKVTKGGTAIFCDSLKYKYGLPEDFVGGSSSIRTIDIEDANKIDEAYRSESLPMFHKQILRMYFISRVIPAIIEKRLSLGYKTFWRHKEKAIEAILKIANDNEKKQEKRDNISLTVREYR